MNDVNDESTTTNNVTVNSVIGWHKCKNQHWIPGYGQQRVWERDRTEKTETEGADDSDDADLASEGFMPVPDDMTLPFD